MCVCVVLVERVELAEGHRQTDRQTDREILAKRVVLAHRERYWHRACTGPSDERSCVTLQAVTLQATPAGSGRLIHGLHSPWIH